MLFPVVKPLKVGTRFAEKLHFHLFKLAGAENKITGGNFVSERLTDLADTKRNLLARGTLGISKVYKNALRRFGTKINLVFGVLGNPLEGLKHKVKLAYIGKIGAAAVGAFYAVFLYVFHHFFVRPAGTRNAEVFQKLVGAVAGFTVFAVHKRVGKTAYVTRSNPNLGVH